MKLDSHNNITSFDLKDSNINSSVNNNKKFELTGAIICYPKSEWITSTLIEQVFLCLINSRDNKDGITRKYEKIARWFLRRVNLWEPAPEFIIYKKDLSKRVWQELARLQKDSPNTLDYVMKSALEMIFECIEEKDEPIFNGRYYLLSVKSNKLLNWRFDRQDDINNDPDSKYNINYPRYTTNGKYLGKKIFDLNNSNKNKYNDVIEGGISI